jgi:hypothetical protein
VLLLHRRGFSIAASGLAASGGYERGTRALLAAGICMCQINCMRQINPFELQQFVNARGVLIGFVSNSGHQARRQRLQVDNLGERRT